MTRLALIADLHFGSVPPGLEDRLLDELVSQDCDALIVAGDLTLTAKASEFAMARQWLDRITIPMLIVPGNHDIPRFDLRQRFFTPFCRYEDAVKSMATERLELPNAEIVGINTVASWQPHLSWQEGIVRRRALKRFADMIAQVPESKYRVAVAHHPFARVPDMKRAKPARRASAMMRIFHETNVDLVLSGHTHQSFLLPVRREGRSFIAVGAPTAMSSRVRGEHNGYWLIDLHGGEMVFQRRLVDDGAFYTDLEKTFSRAPE